MFRLQRRRVETVPGYATDCYDLLLNLYGLDVEYSADSLEDIYKTLSRVGKHVLSETMTDEEAASVLADIAEGIEKSPFDPALVANLNEMAVRTCDFAASVNR